MSDIGILGLGVMGRSLALNIANSGYKVSAYNYTADLTDELMEYHQNGETIKGYYDIKGFVESLKRPRKFFLMVKSGEPVDEMIELLLTHLDKGDLIVDGGNSHYKDTERRIERLTNEGIHYLGVGVSGGEKGALEGPSIMPGGSIEAYKLIEEILNSISAKTELGSCCTYIGEGGAGHFVKTVHNGIEYGIMQVIAETYHIMKRALGMNAEEIGEVFKEWNTAELNSFLMEISYKILPFKDEESQRYLVDMILDKAGQKGTGKWTSEAALDLGIPVPSITTSVDARASTFYKEERVKLSRKITKAYREPMQDKVIILKELEKALLFSVYMIFSQGIWLINTASKEYSYGIDTLEVLRIWKGGCIIRARLLDLLMEVIKEDKNNFNLLNSEKTISFLNDKLSPVISITSLAREYYIPTFGMNTALDYFYTMIEEELPANLIQAQRDFFGAHTYERKDKQGMFHTKWED